MIHHDSANSKLTYTTKLSICNQAMTNRTKKNLQSLSLAVLLKRATLNAIPILKHLNTILNPKKFLSLPCPIAIVSDTKSPTIRFLS